MRRMVKEELLTFEGKPLFPERIAETVPYELSSPKRELYEAVTDYVREEMNRADSRGTATPQAHRRVRADSPAASPGVQPRGHLAVPGAPAGAPERNAAEMLDLTAARPSRDTDDRSPATVDDFDDRRSRRRRAGELEENVVDAATAARTVAELEAEIARARGPGRRSPAGPRRPAATASGRSCASCSWTTALMRDDDGAPRKLIIFTEHRDTLDYLVAQIRTLLGTTRGGR